jgi:glucuronoarabinoxylan endo-1,4-beta-xylanase
MNDVTTSNMVGILASHDYDYAVSPVNTQGKPLWETEVSTFDNFDGSIANGLYWANQIHSFMTVAEANAWNFWWLISYATDNESLVDTNGNPAKRMYVLGQYSRFIRPGYYRIGVLNNSFTSVSAYKYPNSGGFAIVALNTSSTTITQTFNLNGFTAPIVTPWITSGSLSLANQPAVNVTNATFTYTLPAMSVVTFVGQATYSQPIITSMAIQNGKFALTVNGSTGPNYTLLTSTNLTNWQILVTTNSPSLPVTLIDTNPAVGLSRFYRVQHGP